MSRSQVTAALATACALLSACGLGDRQARAEIIIDSVAAAYEQAAMSGTLTVALEVVSVPEAAGSLGLGPPGDAADDTEGPDAAGASDPAAAAAAGTDPGGPGAFPAIVVDVDLDLARRTAFSRYRAVETPFAAFDGIDLYARRHNAGPRDARPWVYVKAEALEKGSGGLAGLDTIPVFGAFAVSPIVILDLAAAPLAGSVEELGTESVAGVSTTHYTANFDFEKMIRDTRKRDYPEEVRESLETLLDLVAVKGTTHPGEVWVGEDGLPRRFEVRLRQEPFSEARFDLIVRLELTDIGTPTHHTLPRPAEIVRVNSVVQFLGAAVPSPDSAEFAAVVIGGPVSG